MDTTIIKCGEKYYFTSEDKVYEINERTTDRLKTRLSSSSDVVFVDCSNEFIENFVSNMLCGFAVLSINRINGMSRCEVSYKKQKSLILKNEVRPCNASK